jgi:hypothetical protein
VTEEGVLRPPFGPAIVEAFERSRQRRPDRVTIVAAQGEAAADGGATTRVEANEAAGGAASGAGAADADPQAPGADDGGLRANQGSLD